MRRRARRSLRPVLIGGAAVLVLGLGAGIASASIPDSSGVIHGCYKPQSDGHDSALGVIDTALSNGHCPSGNTELTWNQTGPQGPEGPTGPQGPAGPSTGGSTGLDLQIIAAQGNQTATATCPSDHPYLFGGGGADLTALSGAQEFRSFPDSAPTSSESETGTGPHGWTSQSGFNDTVTAWAICGK